MTGLSVFCKELSGHTIHSLVVSKESESDLIWERPGGVSVRFARCYYGPWLARGRIESRCAPVASGKLPQRLSAAAVLTEDTGLQVATTNPRRPFDESLAGLFERPLLGWSETVL